MAVPGEPRGTDLFFDWRRKRAGAAERDQKPGRYGDCGADGVRRIITMKRNSKRNSNFSVQI